MHEFSVVKELVEHVRRVAAEREDMDVIEVRLRKDSVLSGTAVQQAFELIVTDTPIADAQLVIEERQVRHVCPGCGFTQIVEAGHLLGHLYICPECDTAEELDEAHGLSILSVTFKEKEYANT